MGQLLRFILEVIFLSCCNFYEFSVIAKLVFFYCPSKNYKRVQFSSVAQSCLTLCDPMNHSMPGLPVHHQLLEFTKTHVHWVSDAIQPSHLLSSPSPPTLNLSQHQGLFNCASSKSLNIYTLALKNKLDYFLHWSDCFLGSEISPHVWNEHPHMCKGNANSWGL